MHEDDFSPVAFSFVRRCSRRTLSRDRCRKAPFRCHLLRPDSDSINYAAVSYIPLLLHAVALLQSLLGIFQLTLVAVDAAGLARGIFRGKQSRLKICNQTQFLLKGFLFF